MGAHILAIKDMAGLCKPYAARAAGPDAQAGNRHPDPLPHARHRRRIQAAAMLKAAEARRRHRRRGDGPDVGRDRQPNLNALVEALRFTPRDTGLDFTTSLQGDRRLLGGGARVLRCRSKRGHAGHGATSTSTKCPAGSTRICTSRRKRWAWPIAGRRSAACMPTSNQLFGDIVKVTPTSKAVGDMALFLVANDLTAERRARRRARAGVSRNRSSTWSRGRMGQPPGGFPAKACSERILRGRAPVEGRPGASLPPADFDEGGRELRKKIRPQSRRSATCFRTCSIRKVFAEFAAHQRKYSDTSVLPTPVFFYGQEPGEEVAVDIEPGKTLIIKFPDRRRSAPRRPPHGLLRAQRPAARRDRRRQERSTHQGAAGECRAQGRPADPTPGRRADARRWSTVAVAAGDRSRRARSC